MKLFIAIALAFFIGYPGRCQGRRKNKITDEAINVTLPIYSGVPDPHWLITPRDANFQKVKDLLSAAKSFRAKYLPEQMPAQLGYKGFLVQENGENETSLILGPQTTELQEELLNSWPNSTTSRRSMRSRKLAKESLKGRLVQAIKSGKVLPVQLKKAKQRPGSKRYVPAWEGATEEWNVPSVQPFNNCYNYANDLITNTFAQPGKGSGQMYSAITNDEIRRGAERDGLVKLWEGRCGSIPHIPGDSRWHLVALVVDPGVDYHWYRKDCNGRWSHKPGGTRVTNRDGNGNLIHDPRLAANNPFGPNYRFVCFMKTDNYEVNIR